MRFKNRLIAVTAVAAMAAALLYGGTLEPGEVTEQPLSLFGHNKETIYFW